MDAFVSRVEGDHGKVEFCINLLCLLSLNRSLDCSIKFQVLAARMSCLVNSYFSLIEMALN